jgi:hypothetical protein
MKEDIKGDPTSLLKELGIFPRKLDIYDRVKDCFKGYVHPDRKKDKEMSTILLKFRYQTFQKNLRPLSI